MCLAVNSVTCCYLYAKGFKGAHVLDSAQVFLLLLTPPIAYSHIHVLPLVKLIFVRSISFTRPS